MKFIEVKNSAGYRVLINTGSIAYVNCIDEIDDEILKTSKLYQESKKLSKEEIRSSIVTTDDVVHYLSNSFDDISSQIY